VRIERLRTELDVEISLRHFPLHPDTPPEGMTLERLFAGRGPGALSQADLQALAHAEGLPYGDRTMTYNSRLAQELGSWAETVASDHPLHDALYRAYFVDGLNLAEADVLVAVAESVGLDSAEARDVLDRRRFRENVDTDWQRSHELGIRGVPTFVVGERMLVGARPYEALVELISA